METCGRVRGCDGSFVVIYRSEFISFFRRGFVRRRGELGVRFRFWISDKLLSVLIASWVFVFRFVFWFGWVVGFSIYVIKVSVVISFRLYSEDVFVWAVEDVSFFSGVFVGI